MSVESIVKQLDSEYEFLGNRSASECHSIGLTCEHCMVSWGGCAAECCCPRCGAEKGYHEKDWNVCYCEKCKGEQHG